MKAPLVAQALVPATPRLVSALGEKPANYRSLSKHPVRKRPDEWACALARNAARKSGQAEPPAPPFSKESGRGRHKCLRHAGLLALLAFPTSALAQTGSGSSLPNPIVLVIVLGALSLAPFVVIMLTSFVKISVVLSILRNALGTQSVPPNQVITGLAFVLTIFIMVPVARQMYDTAGTVSNTRDIFSEASVKSLYDAGQKGKEPLRRFLSKHTHTPDRILFMELAARLDQSARQPTPQAPATPAPPAAAPPGKEDFQILIPAFVTSELKEAFQIGFLVFVPFIIIDMVVANILLAMGMSMLSPSVISLPFKLLLFVLVDGWYMIVRGLVLSYV